MVIFRDARPEDMPAIVALLADDALGAEREAAVDEAYQVAFEQIQSEPRSRLVVAETGGQVAGTRMRVPSGPKPRSSARSSGSAPKGPDAIS